MTIGVGGSSAKIELEKLTNMVTGVKPITLLEYKQRIEKAQQLMKQTNVAAMYLNAGTNLYYFTGTQWYSSERLVGAILPQQGEIQYLAPYFEMDTLKQHMIVEGRVHGWQEHQNPYELFFQYADGIKGH
jgi:Xaa-Pro dipeptidase